MARHPERRLPACKYFGTENIGKSLSVSIYTFTHFHKKSLYIQHFRGFDVIVCMEAKNIIEIKNKKAEYQYFLLDSYTAGLVLTGTEIKSIREGRANLTDAYCAFIGNELYVKQMHIAEYRFGSWLNHAAKRDRKLLLNRKELRKLQNKIKERGFTIVPTLLFINPEGYAKLDISLARGKKFFDKRETIKEKDTRRDMERQLR